MYPLHGEEALLFKTSISFIDHLQEFLSAMLTTCTLVIPPFHELKEYPFSLVNVLQVHYLLKVLNISLVFSLFLEVSQFKLQLILRGNVIKNLFYLRVEIHFKFTAHIFFSHSVFLSYNSQHLSFC